MYLATDSPDLAEYMLDVCDAEPGLTNLAGSGNYSPRPLYVAAVDEVRTARIGIGQQGMGTDLLPAHLTGKISTSSYV